MALEEVIRQVQERAREGEGTDRRSQRREFLRQLTQRIRRRLIEAAEFDPGGADAQEHVKALVRRYIEDEEMNTPLMGLTVPERAEIEQRILATTFGYGVLTEFMVDEAVTEIMVNGLDRIFVERSGVKRRARDRDGNPLAFHDRAEVLAVVEKIVSPLNRKVDEADPIVDARLPDGSRVSIILPPIALDGAKITIRRFPSAPFSLEQLVLKGALSPALYTVLRSLVLAHVNIVVSGGTSTGKTTFLNALGMLLPGDERIVTVEDAAELRFTHVENLARLEARPANIEGKGQIAIRDLVKASLRMAPDRIIVGEVRGGEALDMLVAMNTGHDGSLTTVHANSAQDVISRLETMVLMSGMDLPVKAIRSQIASAIEVIVHLAKLPGGQRRVVEVSEVIGIQDGEVVLSELFRWNPTAPDGGELEWTGRELTRTGKCARHDIPIPRLQEVAAT